MSESLVRVTFVLITIGLAAIGVAGCSAPVPVPSSSSSPTTETSAAPAPSRAAPAPTNLSGEWKQSNGQSGDAYQAATVTADTITIYWVSNKGDTKSLYWAGSYQPPAAAGDFSWVSRNDTTQTGSAMLASSDPVKTFTFEKNQLSYSAAALGTTMTIRLDRK